MVSSQVSIVRCPDYESHRVVQAVRRSLELLGGLEKFIKKGERVLIKPNMLSAKEPKKAVTTHPAVLEAVVCEVKRVGGIPFIGDSPGGAVREVERFWEITGIRKAAEKAKAPLISFEREGVLRRNLNGRTYYIAKAAFEADVVINLPKLKTHNLMLFTGAVKNTFGTVPGYQKTELHRIAFHPEDFSQILVDIFSLVKPQLHVMDAVVGMEGNGPSSGNPKRIGLIIASSDGVALDAVAATIMGFAPGEIITTTEAGKRGLGTSGLKDIKVVGENLREVKIPDFHLPSNRHFRLIPKALATMMGRFLWSRPTADPQKCSDCGVCIRNCPVQGMTSVDGVPVIDYDKCVNCLCCDELCPENAIYLKMSWLARRFA